MTDAAWATDAVWRNTKPFRVEIRIKPEDGSTPSFEEQEAWAVLGMDDRDLDLPEDEVWTRWLMPAWINAVRAFRS